MQTDVKAKNATSTGAASVGPCRIKGIHWVAAAGSISIKDGSSSGTELIKLDTAATNTTYVNFPENGVRFAGDPYVTLTTITSITFFYG